MSSSPINSNPPPGGNQATITEDGTSVSPDMPGDRWFDVQCNTKKLGLKFNGIEITTIESGGWADSVGITLDDEIREVNGQSFLTLSRDEKLALLQKTRPLNIKIKTPVVKDVYYKLELGNTKLGLGFKGACVRDLISGGWGENNGIKVGDYLVELGGVGFASLTSDQRLEKLRGPRPLLLKFKRPARHARADFFETGKIAAIPGVREERKGSKYKSEEKGGNTNYTDSIGKSGSGGGNSNAPIMSSSNQKNGGEGGGVFGMCCCCAPNNGDKGNEFVTVRK